MMIPNASRPSCLANEGVRFRLMSANVAVSCLLLIMFPVALLLNGTAAIVSLRLRSTSSFMVYLKNLVAADLLMTLTLPLMAASMLPGAAAGLRAFACRYSSTTFYSCLYTSITLMGLISLDRFFKIVRPCGKVLGQSPAFSVVMSALVWVVLFGSTVIPTMILTNKDPGNITGDFCMALKGPAGLSLHKFVVVFMETLFWVVSLLIVFCYVCITLKVLQSFRKSGSSNSHGKRKTKLRVFLILLVFFVCFMPLHMMRVPFTLQEIYGINSITCQKWVIGTYKFFLWVSTTNTCLDPLLYTYLCREFKEKLFDMMKARGIPVRFYSGGGEEEVT